MTVGEICTRETVVAARNMMVPEAAQLMRQYHVGSIVVVEENGQGRKPVGIITDRDIVVAMVGKNVEAQNIEVGEIMSGELITVREQDSMLDALDVMRRQGVRRLPVVDSDGALVGLITLDDALEVVAEQLNDLAAVITRERSREAKTRR